MAKNTLIDLLSVFVIRCRTFELLYEDEDVMLTDVVLLSLVDQLEVKLEQSRHDPIFANSALLHQVSLYDIEVVLNGHGVHRLLRFKECENLVGDCLAELFGHCTLEHAASQPKRVDLKASILTSTLGCCLHSL